MSGQQNRSARGAIFGGLAGGIFFFGLAIAVTTGQFLPVLFATLALSSLVGSLSSSNAQGIYGGFQGFVFLIGLAVIAFTNTWWPGILVLTGYYGDSRYAQHPRHCRFIRLRHTQ